MLSTVYVSNLIQVVTFIQGWLSASCILSLFLQKKTNTKQTEGKCERTSKQKKVKETEKLREMKGRKKLNLDIYVASLCMP